MDKGPDLPPEIGTMVGTAGLGLWAFLGGVMRSAADWTDPVTKKFSFRLFAVAIATALVMGEIAAWFGDQMHWEPRAIAVLASALGYLGPAAVMTWVKGRLFGGAKDAAGDPKT